ncbi:MAG: HNH endonuclease, partial [Clostridia bacterium]|nr:HNH endonuclease [Clostridia bacterium]
MVGPIIMQCPSIQLVPRDEHAEEKLNSFSTATEKYNFIVDYYKGIQVDGDIYCEVHHILPVSLGGKNSKDNLVTLPGSIHYVVHFLLPDVMLERNDHDGRVKMLIALNGFKKTRRKSAQVSLIEASEKYASLVKEARAIDSKRKKGVKLSA